MGSDDERLRDYEKLRRLAEEQALKNKDQLTAEIEAELPEGTRRILHELRIHKVELEAQNESLLDAYTEVDLVRARYLELFEHAPVGYCTVNENGMILEGNLTAANMLGVSRGDFEKQFFSRFIFRKDQDIYYLHSKELFLNRSRQTCELRLLRADDTYFWARLEATFSPGSNMSPNGDDLAEPVCLMAITDITETRLVEALGNEKKKLAMLLESFPGFVYLQAPDYTVRYANRNFVEHFGHREGNLCYETLWNRKEPCVDCPTFEVFKTGQSQSWEWEAKNGKTYAVHDHPFIDSDGSNLVIEIGVDITDRRRAEDELARQKELLDAVRRLQDLYITGHERSEVYRKMLNIVVETTGSEYGFVDEVLNDPDGTPYKLSLAMSDIAWDDQSRLLYKDLVAQKLQFRNMKNLSWAPAAQRKTIIANDVSKHQSSCGTPPGHPKLLTYMGIPLYYENEVIGIIGLANRPGGYNRQITEFINPLIQACSAMIWAGRVMRREQEAQAALQASEEKFRIITETAHDGILVMDAGSQITYVNKRMADLLACLPEELPGRQVDSFMFAKDLADHEMRMENRRKGQPEIYERRLKRKDNSEIWVLISATPQYDSAGNYAGSISIYTDITDRKIAQEKIRRLSFYDKLTGLYNRAYLDEEMKRLNTLRQLPVSIIVADLNGLKLFNDAFGHLAGDRLLKAAAGILRAVSRDEDIIARWGGDEFVVLLPQTTLDEAQIICARIKSESAKAVVGKMPISIALGAASKESSSKKLSGVMQEAEDNMYRDKQAESGKFKNKIIRSLLTTLEGISFESEEHIRHMQATASQIAEKLQLSASEVERLKLAISLHDIGITALEKEMLKKKGSLTAEEWEELKTHPEIGFRIARSISDFARVAEEILSHHEYWDGEGYPQGLEGEDIPLLARIIAVADALDVMMSGRPYKEELARKEIIAEFKKFAGTQFDPELVKIIIEILLKEEDF